MPRPSAHPRPCSPLSPVVFAILLSLAGDEKHGYAIMKEVATEPGGSLSIGPGTLYGSLDRLMRDRLVEETGTTDDQRRRYYRLTNFGHAALSAEAARLQSLLGHARRRGIVPARKEA